MPAKSSSKKPAAKPKAGSKSKAPAKAAAKPNAAKKAPAKSASKTAAKTAAKPKAPARKAPPPGPLEVVRPLIRVRQAREFTSKPVTKAELEAITEVARWSGSSRNEQPCRFIAIRDRELIRRVAELGLPQTRGLPTATAAVAIIVPEEPERELSRAFDDGRAAERMLIAAHLLGLGGGVSRVRADVRAGINRALRLPSNRSVRTIVGLGHPTEDALQPKTRPGQARLPREQVIFDECWPEPLTRE
jgi:nitroreductase